MANSSTPENLPQNRLGGLNLNWAITQALAKLGPDAPISEVRDFITQNYGKQGKKAVENTGSLSTGLSAMRKKLRDEASKVPPVPVATNGNTPPAPAVTAKPDLTPTPPPVTATVVANPLQAFGSYVKNTLKPACEVVDKAVAASGGDLTALKQAIAEVESAQKVFGDNLKAVVSSVG